MDGNQGRGARGVDGYCRPLEPQRERNPSDRRAVMVARGHVEAGGRSATRSDQIAVVAVHQAREDAGTAPTQRARIDARVLQRLPAGLEE